MRPSALLLALTVAFPLAADASDSFDSFMERARIHTAATTALQDARVRSGVPLGVTIDAGGMPLATGATLTDGTLTMTHGDRSPSTYDATTGVGSFALGRGGARGRLEVSALGARFHYTGPHGLVEGTSEVLGARPAPSFGARVRFARALRDAGVPRRAASAIANGGRTSITDLRGAHTGHVLLVGSVGGRAPEEHDVAPRAARAVRAALPKR